MFKFASSIISISKYLIFVNRNFQISSSSPAFFSFFSKNTSSRFPFSLSPIFFFLSLDEGEHVYHFPMDSGFLVEKFISTEKRVKWTFRKDFKNENIIKKVKEKKITSEGKLAATRFTEYGYWFCIFIIE